jgi:hypothetical protein
MTLPVAAKRAAVWTALVALAGLVLAAYGYALWRAPALLNQRELSKLHGADRLSAEYNARLMVISLGGALVVAVGLLYTARNYRLSHRGQVTDRFTKALERLGSDELYVRIGGIHALDHVMRDAASHHGGLHTSTRCPHHRCQASGSGELDSSSDRHRRTRPAIGTGRRCTGRSHRPRHPTPPSA